MSNNNNPPVGSIGWVDLTIENTEQLKKFYEQVIGWKSAPVSMGDYDDFTMISPDNDIPYAGICNKKGSNEGLPPHWLIYFNVRNIEESCKNVLELGGEILFEPKLMGNVGKYSVIKDPAGAYCALFEPLEK